MGSSASARRDDHRGLHLDFDAWLERGEAGPQAGRLVERLIGERPAGTRCFELHQDPGGSRVLRLQIWISAWRRPEGC